MSLLYETFVQLISNYTTNSAKIDELWTEIERKHSSKKRFYHDLSHLENMLFQLQKVKSEIQDWDAVIFALYYHDSVYNAKKSNNEEKSTALAKKRMTELLVPEKTIVRCEKHILTTKKHVNDTDQDTNYFLDADLSILGLDWETYFEYSKNVRKEYSIYPDILYIPGRKKVLTHFLEMDHIFKTPFFQFEYEQAAKNNLERELSILNG